MVHTTSQNIAFLCKPETRSKPHGQPLHRPSYNPRLSHLLPEPPSSSCTFAQMHASHGRSGFGPNEYGLGYIGWWYSAKRLRNRRKREKEHILSKWVWSGNIYSPSYQNIILGSHSFHRSFQKFRISPNARALTYTFGVGSVDNV